MKPYLIVTLLGLIVYSACQKPILCEGCNQNKSPIADAGADQVITLPIDSIVLNGSSSSDPDGKITEWQWRKISGPASGDIIKPSDSITPVKKLIVGVYEFELKIKDNGGLFAQDTIQVIVNDATRPNRPPVANAGPDQTITLPTNTIHLDGSASTDPDNNIISYEWKKVSGPSPSIFLNTSSAQTQVTGIVQGTYEFELMVTDAGALFSKDTLQVTVKPETNNPFVNIYVAGMQNNLPVYWKNGQVIPLDNTSYGFMGTSIAVAGDDVFIAGTKNELMWNDYAAKYWKNSEAVSLGDSASATSIAVASGDVYVAGWKWEYKGSGAIAVAKYWKNGHAVTLTNGNKEAYAYSIFIAGNDVYVAGQEENVARYWKNGQPVSLTNGSSSASASSIVVIDNDVYVAGQEGGVAKYWKNGQAVLLPGANVVTSIAVAGGDVYVAGYDHRGQGNSVAKYWKNGQEVSLTSGSEAFATSIAVFGNDVYVAGFEINFPSFTYTAKYWKNGQAYPLSGGGLAGSIVVVN